MLANKLQKLKQELQKMSSDNYCPAALPTATTTTCFLRTQNIVSTLEANADDRNDSFSACFEIFRFISFTHQFSAAICRS